MRILVAFYSETGNTEKVARALHEETSMDHKVHLKKVSAVEPAAFSNYDVVFLGSACHDADLAVPVKKVLKALPDSPAFKLAGFFTHATYLPGGNQAQQTLFSKWAGKCIESFQNISKEKQIDFKGYFNCQGAPSPPIKEFIKREIVTSPDEWEEYEKEVMKHPTLEDLQRAKKFAREIMSQARQEHL
jgi:flavodoxin I